MAHPMFEIIISATKGPDYSAKNDAKALIRGEKKTFDEVHYQPAGEDSKRRCHECVSYLKPGQQQSDCAKVISVVQAEGVCDLWKQRNYGESG